MRISELYRNQKELLSLEELEKLFTEEGYTVARVIFTPSREMYIDGQTKVTEPYTVLCVNRKIVDQDFSVLGIAEFIARLAYLNRSCEEIKVDFDIVHQGKIDSLWLFKTYCSSILPADIPETIKTSYTRLQDFITWAATLNNPAVTDIDYLADLDAIKMQLDDNEEDIDE